MQRTRNLTLDYFKLFLSYLIIVIHLQPLPFSGKLLSINEWLISNGIARIAVPSFLLLNGYFFYDRRNNKEKLYSHAKHLILIYIVWTIIYIPYSNFNPNSIWYSIIIPLLLGHIHLWYIIALVPSLFVVFFMNKMKLSDKYKILFCIGLFCIGYYLEIMFMKKDILFGVYLLLCRNYIFLAVPFVFFGFCLRKYQNKILKIKKLYIYIILIESIILLIIESYLFYTPNRWPLDFYLSLIIICPTILIVLLMTPKFTKAENSSIAKLSEGVYFIQYFSISVIMLFPLEISFLAKSFMTFFISLLFSYCIIQLNKKIDLFL